MPDGQDEEVDDVVMTPMSSNLLSNPVSSPTVLGLSSFVAAEHSAHTAPVWSLQGTGLPVAGTSGVVCSLRSPGTPVSPAQVAFRARVTDLLGLPPRGAPV